jgi:hypothetical protein
MDPIVPYAGLPVHLSDDDPGPCEVAEAVEAGDFDTASRLIEEGDVIEQSRLPLVEADRIRLAAALASRGMGIEEDGGWWVFTSPRPEDDR